MFFVLHELTFAGCAGAELFLQSLRQALGPGTLLLVTEIYGPSDDDRDAFANRGDRELLLVHRLSKQGIRSRAEWLAVYERSGFDVDELIESPGTRKSALVGTAVLRAR
jgi:hypothetical protein